MRIGQVTFYWYGTILCLMTFGVGLVVSMFFPKPEDKQLIGFTIWTPNPKFSRSDTMVDNEEGKSLLAPYDDAEHDADAAMASSLYHSGRGTIQ